MSLVKANYGTRGHQRIADYDAEIAEIVDRNGGEHLTDGFALNGDCFVISEFPDEVTAVKASDALMEHGFFVTDGGWVRKHSKGMAYLASLPR